MGLTWKVKFVSLRHLKYLPHEVMYSRILFMEAVGIVITAVGMDVLDFWLFDIDKTYLNT